MTDLAHQLLLRRTLVGRARRRHRRPPKLPRPRAPKGPILVYTQALRAVTQRLAAAIGAVLHAAGLAARTDAQGDAPPPLPSQLVRARSQLEGIVGRVLDGRDLVAVLDGVATDVSAFSRDQFAAEVRAALGLDLAAGDPHLAAQLAAFRRENVELITSLAETHVARVQGILDDAGSGTRVEDLADQIQDATGATDARAALIARDQVLTLNAQVTQARHEAAGITGYIWRTSEDERVRPDHQALDGQRFDYSSPPVVNTRTGDRGHPGSGDYQCRCTAEPIIPGFDDEATPADPTVDPP